MADAGFFKGTSADQDARFADKKKKLLKTMKFGDNLSHKVDMTRINLDSIRPWVSKRITELLNFEDEVVCDYVLNQLEERYPDPKEVQINITGFLNSKNARIFLTELWDILISAMENEDGVPSVFVEAKKAEILRRQKEEERILQELRRRGEEFQAKGLEAVNKIPNLQNVQLSRDHASQRIASEQFTLIANGAENAASAKKPAEKVESKHSRRSSSSSSRSRHRSSSRKRRRDKHSEKDRRHYREKRHRRRRSSRSPSSPNSSVDRREDRNSRRKHRSRSDSSDKPPPKTEPPAISDWRKDLMAGRRRSPPTMPENYGNDKPKENKPTRSYSRERSHGNSKYDRRGQQSRDIHRDREDSSHRRRSPIDDRREVRRRTAASPNDDRTRRDQERRLYKHDRSPIRSAEELRSKVVYHDRRTQYAQEDEERDERRKRQIDYSKMVTANSAFRRERSPEGPTLPPSSTSKSHSHEIAANESASSDSGTDSEDSGTSDASSGSSSDSEDGNSTGSDCPSPEGPALPPSADPIEPEGPALPPSVNSDHNPDKNAASGSGSSSESDSGDSDSSSSSGSSSSSSDDEDTQPVSKRPKHEATSHRSSERQVKHTSAHHIQDTNKRRKTEPSNNGSKNGREDNAEEALRRRALASLMRASGDRKNPSSS